MILKTTSATIFDTEAISRNDLIRVQHRTWSEAMNGLVVKAAEEIIRVLVVAPIPNVQNHIDIPAAEVENGEWNILWSRDLATINEERGFDET
ncbi:MAG: DUF5026 domain-containing protein [Ruminococcus sp.]